MKIIAILVSIILSSASFYIPITSLSQIKYLTSLEVTPTTKTKPYIFIAIGRTDNTLQPFIIKELSKANDDSRVYNLPNSSRQTTAIDHLAQSFNINISNSNTIIHDISSVNTKEITSGNDIINTAFRHGDYQHLLVRMRGLHYYRYSVSDGTITQAGHRHIGNYAVAITTMPSLMIYLILIVTLYKLITWILFRGIVKQSDYKTSG